ncbi:hypothetical protein HCN44_003254 [Aphidius gifuensis]|uniref:Platelet-derived growth factor receptor-like protein n=1 Tax=Aphidius gifuensis TaxID=684658 RepID=A0A834XIK4_APHGI|nr:hypothetical protein HCN44_003254 [Aphidius gifuensis]
MILSFKSWFVLLIIVKIIDGLQLDYLGIKNKENAEINEKEELTFSCLNDDNNINDISLIYPDNNHHVGLSTYEILIDNKTKTYKKNNATYKDSGWYGCSDNEGNTKNIFIWVKSMEHFFLTNKFEVPSEIEFHSSLVVPCIPTSQSYEVQLFTDSEEIPINVSNGIKFDPQVGFLIKNKSYIHDPVDFTCSITMYNRTENLIYHFQSPANYSGEPKIDTNNPVVNAITGDDVRINCTMYYDISKKFKNIFYWIKLSTKNKRLKSVIHYSDLIKAKKTIELKLLNVSHEDAGEYKCITIGVNGEKSASVHVSIHGSDALTINLTAPKQFYSSKLNKMVILKLNTQSHAKTNITWYNPDGYKIVPINSNGKYAIKNNDKYSALSINNVQLNDAGNYTIKVQISSFKNMEKIITLPLIIEGTPVIKTMDKLQNYYMINDSAELSCYAIGFPTPKIQWSIDKDNLDYQDTINLKNETKLLEKNSTFNWKVKTAGTVTCKACITDDNCTKKIFKISLVDVPGGFGIIPNENNTITAGDKFEISCRASLYIYNQVNWYDEHGTKVVSNDNIIIQKNTTELSHISSLSIKSVPNIKRLIYTCEARRTQNNMIYQRNINVTIHDEMRPYFIDTNMNKTTDYLALMSAPDHDVVSSFDSTLSPLKITIDDKNESGTFNDDYYLTPINVEERRKQFSKQRAVNIDDKTDKKINLNYYNIDPLIEMNEIYHEDIVELNNNNYKNDLNQQVCDHEENDIDEKTPMIDQAAKRRSVLMSNPLYMLSDSTTSLHSTLV